VRMPDYRVALELIADTGPLAVSSANLTGKPAANSAIDAERMLGDSVSIYLDDGPSSFGFASTIIDATPLVPRGANATPGRVRILRDGVVTRTMLEEVLGELLEPAADETAASPSEETS
jgi:L-threonylcarbamoyladenylate synthase